MGEVVVVVAVAVVVDTGTDWPWASDGCGNGDDNNNNGGDAPLVCDRSVSFKRVRFAAAAPTTMGKLAAAHCVAFPRALWSGLSGKGLLIWTMLIDTQTRELTTSLIG